MVNTSQRVPRVVTHALTIRLKVGEIAGAELSGIPLYTADVDTSEGGDGGIQVIITQARHNMADRR